MATLFQLRFFLIKLSNSQPIAFLMFFYSDTDHYRKHSNAMRRENASATDVEEDKISTGTDSETEECDSSG